MTLFQSLATSAGYDPVRGPGTSCLDADASGQCVVPWAGGHKAVSSVVLVANGPRKTAPVAESVLGDITCEVPISYGQSYVAGGGNLVYVLDEEAAAELLERRDEVVAKGFELIDKR